MPLAAGSQVPFTRLDHSDPETQQILTDLYNKLAQVQARLQKIESYQGGEQTPWSSDIDGAGHSLDNVSQIGIGTASPAYALDIAGDCNLTGHYFRSGVQLSIGLQSVVTASRAAGAVYQNTSGKTLFIMTCWNLGGKSSTISALSDTLNPPTTEVAQIADQSNLPATVELFFMVLPGYY